MTKRMQELLEKITTYESLMTAAKKVAKNAGSGGIDAMTSKEIVTWMEANYEELAGKLKTGTYKPKPVLRVEIPKKEKGKTRKLGVPTVIDRCVQQAIADAPTPIYEPTFSEKSYGFRPGRSAHGALKEAVRLANEGCSWVASIDLESFFDEVNHSRLVQVLFDKVKDGRVISLIHRFLRAGVMVDGVRRPTREGTPRGGPLSPLLANITLDALDKELEERGHAYVRYADDILILKRSERAAERTLASMTRFIEDKMLLKVNRDKSFVAHITDTKVRYLGYGFWDAKGTIRLRVHPKSIDTLKNKVRTILARSNGRSLEWRKRRLAYLVHGWVNYFCLADMRGPLERVDKWVRRKIRCVYWKCWKRVRTRFRALQKLGIKRQKAWEWANSRKSYWRVAGSAILDQALNNQCLANLGWTFFSPYYLSVRS